MSSDKLNLKSNKTKFKINFIITGKRNQLQKNKSANKDTAQTSYKITMHVILIKYRDENNSSTLIIFKMIKRIIKMVELGSRTNDTQQNNLCCMSHTIYNIKEEGGVVYVCVLRTVITLHVTPIALG